MKQIWIVRIQWLGDEPPMTVVAEGCSPDEALTDCEERGHYFPAEGDRVISIVQLKRWQRA